jgi:hypothetical protein
MPCYDGGWGEGGSRDYVLEEEVRQLRKTVERFEAVLCGVMTVNPGITEQIDWQEVGITKRQHMNWWREHQTADARRREEQAQRDQKAREQIAKDIAKLQRKLEALDTKIARKEAGKAKAKTKKG